MNKVIVLGSGNAFNTDGRGHACFILEHVGGRRLLLDAGATALCRLEEYGVSIEDVDTAVLTHFHGDHAFGLPFLLLHMNFVLDRRRPFTVAGPPGTARACLDVFELAYTGIDLAFDLEFVELDGAAVTREGFRIEPHPVEHRPESLAYRITGPSGRAVAYSGDCRFDDRLIRLVDGADLALLEVSMMSQTTPPLAHVSVDELRAHRDRLRAGRLVLTHLDDRIAARIIEEGLGEPASDGMEIEL